MASTRLHRVSKVNRGTWCSWFITFASHFGGFAKGVRFNSGCVHNKLFFFLNLSVRSFYQSAVYCLHLHFHACPLHILYLCAQCIAGGALCKMAFVLQAWDSLRLDLSTSGSFAMSIQTVGLYPVLLSYSLCRCFLPAITTSCELAGLIYYTLLPSCNLSSASPLLRPQILNLPCTDAYSGPLPSSPMQHSSTWYAQIPITHPSDSYTD